MFFVVGHQWVWFVFLLLGCYWLPPFLLLCILCTSGAVVVFCALVYKVQVIKYIELVAGWESRIPEKRNSGLWCFIWIQDDPNRTTLFIGRDNILGHSCIPLISVHFVKLGFVWPVELFTGAPFSLWKVSHKTFIGIFHLSGNRQIRDFKAVRQIRFIACSQLGRF